MSRVRGRFALPPHSIWPFGNLPHFRLFEHLCPFGGRNRPETRSPTLKAPAALHEHAHSFCYAGIRELGVL